MFEEKLDPGYIVTQSGTSEGTQIKYKKDGYWYKLDTNGREGLCEYLASHLLTYSDLKSDEYILYEQGTINGTPGCRSKDYLTDKNDEFITLYRLYYNEFGRNLADALAGFDRVEERIEYTISFVKQSCGIDITDYLAKSITLDSIILNEDRHVNNLALIGSDQGFRPAPIFDNGHSLLTANRSVNWNFPMEDNVRRVIAKPFSGSYQAMLKFFGKGFQLDVSNALKWLEKEQASRERDVLVYMLEHSIF